ILFIFVFGEVGFQSFCKFSSRKHDAAPTAFTFKPNICTKTRNNPFIRAAWMLFAQSQMVVETEVRKHIYKEEGYEYYKLNYDKLRIRNSPNKRCLAEERSNEVSCFRII